MFVLFERFFRNYSLQPRETQEYIVRMPVLIQ